MTVLQLMRELLDMPMEAEVLISGRYDEFDLGVPMISVQRENRRVYLEFDDSKKRAEEGSL